MQVSECIHTFLHQVEVVEASRDALRNEYDQLVLELEAGQVTVQQLEKRLREEGERREEEVERRARVMEDLQQQLKSSEERWTRSQTEV